MRRVGRRRGFTLIEILVVVVVLSILMLILLPLLQTAIQKTKQKSTMSDISDMAKAVISFITDTGAAPTSPDGALEPDSAFIRELTPVQKFTISINDQWGTPLRVWTGASVGQVFGIDASGVGMEDFVIQSLGRDAADEGFNYDPANPGNNFYVVREMEDFSRDLILWNGGWIHAPRSSG